MSRSGYSDDIDAGELGLWRGAVQRAIGGKRGQQLLRDLLVALDSMEDKRLYPGSFSTSDGEYCALGVVGKMRGVKMDDLGDDDDCDTGLVGNRFNIARALAAEIMYLNDEYSADERKRIDVVICGPVRPHYPDWGRQTRSVLVENKDHPTERWNYMRNWAKKNIKL